MTNSILTPDHQALAEERGAHPVTHHAPQDFSDRFAFGFTKLLRFCADTFFAKRYGHRAIVLETVAAVPGMVGAMFTHLTSLRRMKDDEGWIRTLLEEAENERMHLMTFIEVAKPTLFERLVILLAQWIFLALFSLLYLISSRTAHRVVGYFEEEAVISYTLYLKEIDEGRSPNVPAPAIAIHYWKMPADATSCYSCGPTRRIIATSTTVSPTSLAACRSTCRRLPLTRRMPPRCGLPHE